ncbi:PQ-loop repeat-containing protein [Sporobolomyces koalae]|uniref:PQ-loop repeat-containing protein n=1 Tax=Sporobolomyces koalae TaxID=500713 RepID=UPI003173512C
MLSPARDPFAALHSRPIVSRETCAAAFQHNRTGEILSTCIVVGLVVSYAPQFYRIIRYRNSEGFSPLFLFLGATSSASSLGNIVALQWGQVACCKYLTGGQCFESVLGIVQIFTQWFCFNLVFVLYLLYYPLHAKYVRSVPITEASLPSSHRSPKPFYDSLVPAFMRTSTPSNLIRPSPSRAQQSRRSQTLSVPGSDTEGDTDHDRDDDDDASSSSSSFDPRNVLLPGQVRQGLIILSPSYRHSLSYFFLMLLHLLLTFLTTSILLVTLPGAPARDSDGSGGSGGGGREHPSERAVRVWATTLGLLSVALGCCQYAPQLVHTARNKVVGSLSIPMMLLQTPGSFVFVYTLAIRPGVNFTGWAPYFVTGVLQGTLLVLCLIFKRRQARLGLDDWGNKAGSTEQAHERSRLLR